jgi:predicted helicase
MTTRLTRWCGQVLQALRSHDDRFDAMINKLDLIGSDKSKMEVIAITDKIQKKQTQQPGKKKGPTGKGGFTISVSQLSKTYGDRHSSRFAI